MSEPLTPLRVLVVDDDRLVRTAMVRTLKRLPAVTVEDFGIAQEALVRAQSTHFDVAVLDLRMPVLDGVALAEKLREAQRGIRVIFVTADPHCELAVRARALNPHGLLPKPWPPAELATLLRS